MIGGVYSPEIDLSRDRRRECVLAAYSFGILTILPLACGSFGSFTTVT